MLDADPLVDRTATSPASGLDYFPSLEIDAPMLGAATSPAAIVAGGALHPLSALPVLDSLPGAAATLYLDFDGHFESRWGSYSNITTPVFDTDGDAATFSDAELAAIRRIWQSVAEDYSPFDINVTTVVPPSFANGAAQRISIGGSGSWLGNYGGVSYLNSFTNALVNTSYVFPDHLGHGTPKYVAEATSHEAGHAFGLEHQSQFDDAGKKVAEYYAGPGDGTAPIMGNSYKAERGLWWSGSPSSAATAIQDDLTVLARPQNGFGFRADDYGDTTFTAFEVPVVGGAFTVAGVVAQTTDRDVFAFQTGAGRVRLTVALAVGVNDLDARLELQDAAGTVLAAADPDDSFGATLDLDVAAGAYRAVVMSHGRYGDVGQYALSGAVVPTDGRVNASAKLIVKSATAQQVRLQWNDFGTRETGYTLERSTDGVQWESRAALRANARQFVDTAVVAGATYYYRVAAVQATVGPSVSNLVGVTLAPAIPGGLAAVATSAARIELTWTAVDGATTYRIERSTDGVRFSQVAASEGTSVILAGLVGNTRYYFRVAAANAGGVSPFGPAASVLTLPTPSSLLAPSNVTAAVLSSTQVRLTWKDDSRNEVGFFVDRSSDGGRTWKLVGILYPNSTSFIDAHALSGKTSYYRVGAFDRRVAASAEVVKVAVPRR